MQVAVVKGIIVDLSLVVDLPLETLNLVEVDLSLLLIIKALSLLFFLQFHQFLIPLPFFYDIRLLDIADNLIICFLHDKFVLFEDLPQELFQHFI